MSYEIEKSVALPERKFGAVSGKSKYPFAAMEVGDSFFLPEPDALRRVMLQNTVLGSARASRANGKKFTTRTTENGVRVWRTA